MPFTLSHAVVALPFVRTPLVPAAVAIGAMIPDLPVFVRASPVDYGVTHDLRWLPVTVTMGVLALLLWRMLLRPAAIELLPRRVARSIPVSWDARAGRSFRGTFVRRGEEAPTPVGTLLLIAALTIGIISHVVWDAFTHEGRWGSEVFPALAESWGPMPGYRWLQYASGVFGLTVLGVWLIRWILRAPRRAVERTLPGAIRWFWWLSLPVVLVGAAAVAAGVAAAQGRGLSRTDAVYHAMVPAAAGWATATIALCVVLGWLRRRRVVAS